MTTINVVGSGPTQYTVQQGENTAEAARQATNAAADAARAEAAADVADGSRRYFATVAAGISGTTAPDTFTSDESGTLTWYDADGNSLGQPATRAQVTAVETAQTTSDALLDRVGDAVNTTRPQRPAYIEQRYALAFGRGMIDAEADAVVSDQAVTNAPLAIGASVINVADLTKFDALSPVMIDHSDGTVGSYWVSAIGSGLSITPPLRKAVASGGRVERLWWNRAHIGKRGMQWLAQRIATGTEYELAMPMGEATIHVTDPDNELSGVGLTASYFDGANTGDGTSPIRFPTRSAFVDTIADGQGIQTGLHTVSRAGRQICRVRAFINVTSTQYVIRIRDGDGVLLVEHEIDDAEQKTKDYQFAFNSRSARQLKVQIVASGATAGSATEYISVSNVDVFPAPDTDGAVIARKDATIVVFGDSWATDDVAERPGIASKLATELPSATVIDEGVGGNTLPDLLARWDADVLAHDPDYVVVVVGTNDAYSPSSATFDPTARDNVRGYYRKLLSLADKAGIRLVLIGPPGLAQNDASVPALAEWELNERAGAYALDLEQDAALAAATSTFQGALVKKSASQTAADFTTETAITWDSEDYDTDGFHDNATNSERLTIPAGVSKVRLSAGLLVNNVDAGNYMRLRIYKNGSTGFYAGMGGGYSYNDASNAHIYCQTAVISVVAGDYFDARLLLESDTSVDILADPSWFSVEVVE